VIAPGIALPEKLPVEDGFYADTCDKPQGWLNIKNGAPVVDVRSPFGNCERSVIKKSTHTFIVATKCPNREPSETRVTILNPTEFLSSKEN
jgi:hypothetical protein